MFFLPDSGVGSNFQENAWGTQSPAEIFFDVPRTFLLCPPHGGTTIVCYRLRDKCPLVSALQSAVTAHLLVKSGEGQ